MLLARLDLVPVFAVVGLGAAIIFVLKFTGARTARDTRAAAMSLGMGVADVMREVPVSGDRGRTWRLETSHCVEYYLRRKDSSLCTWQLLMRSGEQNEGLPPGWRFVSERGSPSQELQRALNVVMRDEALEGEFFEFQGTEAAVSVYWEEWGGQAMAARLLTHLRSLTEIPE